MPHNASRYSAQRLQLEDELQSDRYKARSVWGKWWQLDAEFKARHFSQDEQRWIRRYGAKLDELANGAREPRTEKEREFVSVTLGGAKPTTDKQRLWLRVQMACLYEESLRRAALCNQAMELAAGLEAETLAMRRYARETEDYALEVIQELRMLGGDPDTIRSRAIENVEWASWMFAEEQFIGPPPVRFMAGSHPKRWLPQIYPVGVSAIAQS